MGEWVLRGREHHDLAAIALESESDAAIALSIGGAPKVYAHTDPNEDAALLVVGQDHLLLAVADGHGGHEAAEIAVEALRSWDADLGARRDGEAGWGRLALGALVLANQRIRTLSAHRSRRGSRTTLAIARIDLGAATLRWASIGDSHVFCAGRVVRDLASAAEGGAPHDLPFFLGIGAETEASLAGKCRIGEQRLDGVRAVVLATDGLSEHDIGVDVPEDAVASAVARAQAAAFGDRGAVLARAVAEAALDAHRRHHSGDNIAAAAAWIGV